MTRRDERHHASAFLDPYLLALILGTTVLGVIIGVLPGLGATTGAALLLPFTLTMDSVHAISVLATIYVSATFAGSITAILINTPGTSAAAATTFDGYPLAQRGEAGRALGVAVVSSTVGGVFSVAVLCVAAPLLARVADTVAMKAVKLPTKEDYRRIWKTILRSCGIGTFIGILPAEGATVASMIGYAEARRWSRNKEEFGKGAVEGIAGAEAANNAATGGAMVPTMVLGIPGSGTTAVILVGLMVHGLRPGPYLFTEQVDKVYQIFGAMLLANIMFMAMGLYAAKVFARISLVPTPILWPVVFALSVIGAYALNAALLDVWIVLIFGVIGFFARRHGFAVAPIAVGLILGEMVETNLQNSLKMFEGQWWLIAAQPLAALFLVLAVLGLSGQWLFQRLFGSRR